MKTKIASVLALLAAAFISTANAEGLLGEKYVGLSYQRADVEGIDGWGAAAEINLPAIPKDNGGALGMDAIIAISYAELDDSWLEVSGKQIDLGVRLFNQQSKIFKPFAGLYAGNGEMSILGIDDSSMIYQFELGGEFAAGDKVSITPYVRFVEIADLPDGSDEALGLDVSVWVSESSNLGLQYETVSDSGIRADIFSLAYRFRF